MRLRPRPSGTRSGPTEKKICVTFSSAGRTVQEGLERERREMRGKTWKPRSAARAAMGEDKRGSQEGVEPPFIHLDSFCVVEVLSML